MRLAVFSNLFLVATIYQASMLSDGVINLRAACNRLLARDLKEFQHRPFNQTDTLEMAAATATMEMKMKMKMRKRDRDRDTTTTNAVTVPAEKLTGAADQS